MSEQTTATVETLTAEVRVLVVGNRQITLSVAKQLDEVPLWDMLPFGRVSVGKTHGVWGRVIGRHKRTGALVLAPYMLHKSEHGGDAPHAAARELPLIVLAGLR